MSIYGITSKEAATNNKKIERKVNQSRSFIIPEDKGKEEEIASDNVHLLNKVNPFIIFNEINQDEREREELKKEGNKLIASLNRIRLALLSGSLSIEIIENLAKTLDECSFSFTSYEAQSLINEIKLRAEVEIAKFNRT